MKDFFNGLLDLWPVILVGLAVVAFLGVAYYGIKAINEHEDEMNVKCKQQYDAGKLDYECHQFMNKPKNNTLVVPIIIPMGR